MAREPQKKRIHYGWSEHETTLMTELWGKISCKALAVALARTVGAVHSKSQRMDLPGLHVRRLRSETFKAVLTEVSRTTGVSALEIMADVRRREVCRARWTVFKKLRDEGYSLPQIGKHANRHHTTVMWGIAALRKARGDPKS